MAQYRQYNTIPSAMPDATTYAVDNYAISDLLQRWLIPAPPPTPPADFPVDPESLLRLAKLTYTGIEVIDCAVVDGTQIRMHYRYPPNTRQHVMNCSLLNFKAEVDMALDRALDRARATTSAPANEGAYRTRPPEHLLGVRQYNHD